MMEFNSLFSDIQETPLQAWQEHLAHQLAIVMQKKNGNLPRWLPVLEGLPNVTPSHIDLDSDTLIIGRKQDCDPQTHAHIHDALRKLMPWRKGPFSLFDIFIDTEWRSDWKWQRLRPHLADMQGRTILDVGSGSGYHCWRMHAQGASLVIGIDPSMLFLMQFSVLKHFLGARPVHMLPFGIEHMREQLPHFDTVFSMGVLYHRRSPIDHLIQLKNCLRPGGELVLETLVIEGEPGVTLMPENRYAKMRNVWFIPGVPTLELWLRRCGFENIRCVDINQTSTQEQRRTDWMTFESLADFLDPQDSNKTVEGYPAPVRATVLANKAN